MKHFASVFDVVKHQQPRDPVFLYRRDSIHKSVAWFQQHFNGHILYAVKTNPEKFVLKDIYAAGIRHFDVASLGEIELISSLFSDAHLHFMHTVKNRDAIREAYFNYGIRDFSLDSVDELEKIVFATHHAKDLNLIVRIAIPNTHAELDLSGKFGILPHLAPRLLTLARKYAQKLGICFHVGSQCMHPNAFSMALKQVRQVIQQANVPVEVIDVGGGFPSIYPGMIPPPLSDYCETISEEIETLGLANGTEIWCEPGRAIVAESGSVIARVELRKGEYLYINDGTYGSLFDAGYPGFIYPVRLLRGDKGANLLPYSFYGPTCDSLDFMKGPFYLPADVAEGDYIEIGQLGSYSRTLRTKFNGFYCDDVVTVGDEPILSIFSLQEEEREEKEALNS
ncbi:MAG: type III PLP-dependent enzyme [Alphaproteobacteria bacterium]|nr:type III PLP-dependent enzyme [Alphaproteobacteria bacterium]